jgi:hypothetical protein
MKEQKRKYDCPLMERVLVELEDGFCAGSANVQNGPKQAGIEEHKVNTNFTFDYTDTSVDKDRNTWD